jgi:hypothetical protein
MRLSGVVSSTQVPSHVESMAIVKALLESTPLFMLQEYAERARIEVDDGSNERAVVMATAKFLALYESLVKRAPTAGLT